MISKNSIKKKSIDIVKDIPYFDELQEKMTSNIISSFDEIVKDRINHHSQFQFTSIDPIKLKKIYTSYANKEGLTNGIGNIVPGGASYLTILPLLINSYKNQTKMVCDLAVQMGKKDMLESKEVVLAILLSTAGDSANQLIANQANKIFIQKLSTTLMPKVMEKIGSNLLTKSLGSAFTSAVPGIGALAIGMFVRYNTKQLGKLSIELLSKDIQFTDNLTLIENKTNYSQTYSKQDINAEMVKVYINIMKSDSVIQNNEIGYIISLINVIELENNIKIKLIESLTNYTFLDLNYDILKLISNLKLFVFDMLAFCEIDKNISLKEIAYVSKILKRLDLGTIDEYVI